MSKPKLAPVTRAVGISMASSVDIAKAAYEAGWRSASLAIAEALHMQPDSSKWIVIAADAAAVIQPSPAIEAMAKALS